MDLAITHTIDDIYDLPDGKHRKTTLSPVKV